MHLIKPQWLTHPGMGTSSCRSYIMLLIQHPRALLTAFRMTGDLKDIEVYSCHVSPDGKRLATAAGGPYTQYCAAHTRCAAMNNVTDRIA